MSQAADWIREAAGSAVYRQAPEVGAGWFNDQVRICAGGAQQWAFLPRLRGDRGNPVPYREDGLRAIKVWGQDPATDPRQWVQEYRRLWTIEACFRANKHDVKIRPVFHWKPGRVKAHLAICYLAFCCLQHLRHRLSVMGTPMSPAAIQRTLNQLQFSLLVHPNSGRQFALPSPTTTESRRLYRVLGLPWNEAPFVVSPRSRNKRKSRRPRQD